MKKREKRYKKLKKLVLDGKKDEKVLEKFGSEDYKNSSLVMKSVMAKVVNEDIREELKEIETPTLIFWGKKDKITPLKMGKATNQLIKNSKFVILDGEHFSHIDSFNLFNEKCLEFWRSL